MMQVAIQKSAIARESLHGSVTAAVYSGGGGGGGVQRGLRREAATVLLGAIRSILWRFCVGIAQNADLINTIFGGRVAPFPVA